ncbi:MAG: response regulator transcription factor [Chloroflexota bacterium]|nr:MAG: response regulator transcription factor [Chloroflexota bacterium]
MNRIRVLLADDHTVVRAGIRTLLDSEPDMEVIGEASNGREAVRKVGELRPDVVVMDIAMPELDGMKATRELIARQPDIRVVVLTMHDDEEYFFEVLNAGAMGYVLKNAAPTDLVTAIRTVSQGNVFLYPTVAKLLVQDFVRRGAPDDRPSSDGLTDRELEVLRLIAEGRTNQEIADNLCLSINTVQVHRAHIMEKLDLHNRAALVKYAIKKGLIDLDG